MAHIREGGWIVGAILVFEIYINTTFGTSWDINRQAQREEQSKEIKSSVCFHLSGQIGQIGILIKKEDKFKNLKPQIESLIATQVIIRQRMQQINPLKKINLEQYQRPKTLIVVYYKGKRISVPLLGDCKNLTQMLYHHIDKFQQTVLKNDQKWQILSKKKIVCFCSSSLNNEKSSKQAKTIKKQCNSIKRNIQKYLKYQDGDLKIDILLSMIRIQSDSQRPVLQITKFYKYMEIEPYYIKYQISDQLNEKENPMKHKYYLYRLLEKNKVKNTYLARSLQNGYFYSIKVYRSGLKMAERQAKFIQAAKNNKYSQMRSPLKRNQGPNISTYQILPIMEIFMVPSEEEEDEEDESVQMRYKHLSIIQKYNIKGKLQDRIHDKNTKITENDLLRYIKQLIWIGYQLHEEYNIIHRNLTPESFEIDEAGDLNLVTFSSWIECYNRNGQAISYPIDKNAGKSDRSHDSRIYEEQFQVISDGWYNIGHYTPPEVISKSKDGYNKFVDYYTIGVVIKEIYQKIFEFQIKTENKTLSALVEKIISKLTSQNISERDQIVLQLIQSIKKSKLQNTQSKPRQVSLNLNEIKLGQFINVDFSQTCVQNQIIDLDFNGISHHQIINYFKPIKQLKDSLHQNNATQQQFKQQKSKEKIKHLNLIKNYKNQHFNVSNSRDKSVKSIKSSSSKAKSRTKSKVSTQKLDKNVKNKSKSKPQKKNSPPQRNQVAEINTILNPNSKQKKRNGHQTPTQNKSKPKSCDKIKADKSPKHKFKEQKQRQLTQTATSGIDAYKVISRTGIHAPLPKNPYKSPSGHS